MEQQTAHKAHAAAIASAAMAVILAVFGLVPSTEEILAGHLNALVESIAAAALSIAGPWLAAYYVRNKPK